MDSRGERETTRMSTIGMWRRRLLRKARLIRHQGGFTFLELAVVILLIGLMIGLSTPRIRYALLTDDLKGTARTIIGLVKGLREDAIREQRAYWIYFDLESNRYWVAWTSMTLEEEARARERASTLPQGVRVKDIWFRDKGKTATGEAAIRFDRRGYVPHSVIHLGSEDGRDFTLELSPFLGRIKVYEKYIDFVS